MLRLLIDENVDHRILRGLLRRVPQLDFLVVAQIGLAGTPDIELLRWAAQENRTIVTHDVNTMVPDAEELIAQYEAYRWCNPGSQRNEDRRGHS